MTTSAPIAAGIPESRRRLAAMAIVAFALSGCTAIQERLPRRSPPPEPPRRTVAKPAPAPTPPKPQPAQPAPVDAHGFTVIAPASWDRDRVRVRGALAKADPKALAPADVGYYLDILQGRLRQVTAGRTTRRGRGFAVDLSSSVRFAPGAAPLGPGSAEALAPLAKLLDEYEQLMVAVRVNPDSGSAPDAQLAQQRAVGLARELAGSGIARKRIIVYGNTPGRPAGSARVEVLLEPIVRATEPSNR